MRRRDGRMWAVLGIITGGVYALEAVLDASSKVLVVTAIVIGLTYSLFAVLRRR